MPRKLDDPAIDHLAATPEVLRLLMGGLSDEDARWKPAADRWSVAEILEHLSHIEGHYFRSALDRVVAGDDAEIEPYDQDAYAAAGTYSNREAEESFAHWEEQREDNVEFLRGLDAGVLARTARHPALGIVTAGDLLNEWALHDLGHVRQITELVRARMYYPKLGPFQAQYQVHP
jgi:DinB family protein